MTGAAFVHTHTHIHHPRPIGFSLKFHVLFCPPLEGNIALWRMKYPLWWITMPLEWTEKQATRGYIIPLSMIVLSVPLGESRKTIPSEFALHQASGWHLCSTTSRAPLGLDQSYSVYNHTRYITRRSQIEPCNSTTLIPNHHRSPTAKSTTWEQGYEHTLL